jgi:hypothetical protein
MNVAYIGPRRRPTVVAHAQINMSQTRCFILNMSSKLPDTITEGTADMTPETNLPMIAPATEYVTPTMIHDTQ